MPNQPKLHQADLFAPHGVQRAQSQVWQALPVETRRMVTHLMARLIFDHAARDAILNQVMGRHDV